MFSHEVQVTLPGVSGRGGARGGEEGGRCSDTLLLQADTHRG